MRTAGPPLTGPLPPAAAAGGWEPVRGTILTSGPLLLLNLALPRGGGGGGCWRAVLVPGRGTMRTLGWPGMRKAGLARGGGGGRAPGLGRGTTLTLVLLLLPAALEAPVLTWPSFLLAEDVSLATAGALLGGRGTTLTTGAFGCCVEDEADGLSLPEAALLVAGAPLLLPVGLLLPPMRSAEATPLPWAEWNR